MTEPISLDAQIAELKREIAIRKNVYPKWVRDEKMRKAEADHCFAAMAAALHTVMAVKRLRATITEHFPGEIDGTVLCRCKECEASVEGWLDHVFAQSKAAAESETGES